MIRIDKEQITSFLIDECLEDALNASEEPECCALDAALNDSVMLKTIRRNMPPLCGRQSAFKWLRAGLVLGFEIAERAARREKNQA